MTLAFRSRVLAAHCGALLISGAALGQGSDSCSGAQAISGLGIFPFDTTASSDSASSGCTMFRDVWFAWTAPATDTFTVSTCGFASFDTELAAYAGTTCPPVTPLACNDDSCGLQSTIFFGGASGATYLIRAGGFSTTSTGAGSIEITQGISGGCSDPATGPDVIVGDLNGLADYGSVGAISAYAVGTTSCNVGDAELQWIAGNRFHPVIAQNMFRVENGRFEQVGQSWLKHGFTALQQTLCCDCISSGTGSRLGVGCSDPYGATLNGSQSGLGPRFQVDAHTGFFVYPFFAQGQTGNAIYKRLQVLTDDLDPAKHPGSTYFVEGHYVSPDDATAGNQNNNASYRQIRVTGFSGGSWDITFSGSTQRTLPAIQAWQDQDPGVHLEYIQIPGEGLVVLGSNAVSNPDGTWTYSYAIQNLNSDRSVGGFSVPVEVGAFIGDVFFRDVPYHSGEPFDGTDWTSSVNPDSVEWQSIPYATDPDANALRWSNTYSFGFVSSYTPEMGTATLGLFKTGTPDSVTGAVLAPLGDRDCFSTNYCTTSPTSFGPGAVMSSSGSMRISDNTFQLIAMGAVPGEFGLFYYGPDQVSLPFGDGTQCVGAGTRGLFRLHPPIRAAFDGLVLRLLDFTVPPAGSGPGAISAGESWNFQYWFRDPLGPGGSGFNLSDGLQATFCP